LKHSVHKTFFTTTSHLPLTRWKKLLAVWVAAGSGWHIVGKRVCSEVEAHGNPDKVDGSAFHGCAQVAVMVFIVLHP
jgi:hypothetical protein